MLKLLVFAVILSLCQCSVLNNVSIVDYASYVLEVIKGVVAEVDRRHFQDLKIPDIVMNVNETVFSEQYTGTVTYGNAFVASIQHLEIDSSTVRQVWLWNSTSSTVTVSLQGTLRMHEVALGFDVTADLEDGTHHYTAVFTHELPRFSFHVIYNVHEDTKTASVVGTIANSNRLISFMPRDKVTEVLMTLFTPASTIPGMLAWGEEVFAPILQRVAETVEFPRICYDCPIS